MNRDEQEEYINQWGIQGIIVDLLNSMSAVRELSELTPQAGNEKELVCKALSILIQNQDMERCSFFILDGKDNLINLTGLSSGEYLGAEKNQTMPLTFKIGEGIIGLAAGTGKIQHCDNCKEDARFSNIDRFASGFLPGSVISVPVSVHGELIGVLNISHPDTQYFSEWHIRLLHIYKNMMGELISNYRLLQRMEEQITVRTRKLEAAIEDIKRLKEHHESLSMRDELTGLYNRRYFYAHIEAVLARTKRFNQSLCILLLDLDYFKVINDTFGHGFGDIVLKDIAVAVREEIRESDIFVRFGGEEFIITFTDIDCTKGKLFAERIREKIASLCWKVKEQEVKATASIGMHCLTGKYLEQDNLDIDTLILYADKALYRAKAAGRNRVMLFSCEAPEK